MRPRVVIIGAGALGKCLAAILVNKANVTVYERNPIVCQKLREEGFVFKEGSRTQKVRIKVAPSLQALRSEEIDLLIFATKVMDLRAAVRASAKLDPRCVFLPQNGLFDINWIRRFFKKADVCRGVTTMACHETVLGQVTLFYRGNMYIGGDGSSLVASLFRKCGIETNAYRDSNGSIWAKLIFSAVMNPLPVIAAQGYDVLRKDQKVWKLVRRAVEEGRSVARTLGVRLAFNPLKLIHRVRNGDLAGIAHRGTIFQDFCAGRSTEIDYITGALVRQARKAGVKAPALNSILAKAKAVGA